MNIKVTECNSCPFKYYTTHRGYNTLSMCKLHKDQLPWKHLNTERKDIPNNCPIKLNNGSITITI